MKFGLRSRFTFPVIVQGQVTAFLEFFAEEPRPPDTVLLEAIGSVGAQLARLIERGRADVVRAQLAAIVESSQDAIVSTAPDRTILTWNTGAERLFGYTASEAIGRDLSFLVPDNVRHEIGRHRALALTGQHIPPARSNGSPKTGAACPSRSAPRRSRTAPAT
ncbi:MAG: PAS domain S-box protein [Betaproteobacteria bacterium]|nr:PAS domain S-box protein [Betaproteobacteria bacterium]